MRALGSGAWELSAPLSAALLCQLGLLASFSAGEHVEGQVSLGAGEWVISTVIGQDPPRANVAFSIGLNQQHHTWPGVLPWADEIKIVEDLSIQFVALMDENWVPKDYGPQGAQPCPRQGDSTRGNRLSASRLAEVVSAQVGRPFERNKNYPPTRQWTVEQSFSSSSRRYIWFIVLSTCSSHAARSNLMGAGGNQTGGTRAGGNLTRLDAHTRVSLWWRYHFSCNGSELAADVAPTLPFTCLSLILSLWVLLLQRYGSRHPGGLSLPFWWRILALAAVADAGSMLTTLIGLEIIRRGGAFPEMMVGAALILELLGYAFLSSAAVALPIQRMAIQRMALQHWPSRCLADLYGALGWLGFVVVLLHGLMLTFYGILVATVILRLRVWPGAGASLYVDRARVSGSPCGVVEGLALLVWLALLLQQAKTGFAREQGGLTWWQCLGANAALLGRPLLILSCSFVSIHTRPLFGSILRLLFIAMVYFTFLWDTIRDVASAASAALYELFRDLVRCVADRIFDRVPLSRRSLRLCMLAGIGIIALYAQSQLSKPLQSLPVTASIFEGTWVVIDPGLTREILIDASGTIHWPRGEESMLRSEGDLVNRQYFTRVRNITYRARLEADGKLVWDFGDVWAVPSRTNTTTTTTRKPSTTKTTIRKSSTAKTTIRKPSTTKQNTRRKPSTAKTTTRKPSTAKTTNKKTEPPNCIHEAKESEYFREAVTLGGDHVDCAFGGLCGKTIRNDERIDYIRNVMSTTKKMLSDAGLMDWSLDMGTLLGAQRCGDMLPWDEDCDIFVSEEGIKTLFNKFFSTYNYTYPLRRISAKLDDRYVLVVKGHCIPLEVVDSHSGFYCDLFMNTKVSGRIERQWPYAPAQKDISLTKPYYCSEKGFVWSLSTLYPTKICDFAGEKYRCVNNPDSYLTTVYGKNWRVPKKNKRI